jgi:FlaA1/EpsC-like NDP-sugar epimerase
LFEELLGAEEGSEPTAHPRIFRARNPRVWAENEILPDVESLIDMCSNGCSREGIIGRLMDIVPTYNPQGFQVGDNKTT